MVSESEESMLSVFRSLKHKAKKLKYTINYLNDKKVLSMDELKVLSKYNNLIDQYEKLQKLIKDRNT